MQNYTLNGMQRMFTHFMVTRLHCLVFLVIYFQVYFDTFFMLT